jgi:hypothetical protein
MISAAGIGTIAIVLKAERRAQRVVRQGAGLCAGARLQQT